MKYWLLKTEPSVYSFDDLLKDKKTVWDGVANNAALICIRNARKGDLARVSGDKDDRDVLRFGLCRKDAAHVEPGHPRHFNVQEDERWLQLCGELNRPLATGGHCRFVPFDAEQLH